MTIYSEYLSSNDRIYGLVCIPHSGEVIPEEFIPFLTDDLRALNEDVDFRVFDLINIAKLNENGIDIICAHNIRTTVDLNRPRSLALLNWNENTKGIKLVKEKPNNEEDLLQKYYDPYFKRVRELLERINYGQKRAIDLHSMPSRPTSYHLKKNPNQSQDRPDFCLSDLEGKSSPKDLMDFSLNCFREKGYNPGYNDPYKGGEGTVFLMNQFDTHSMQIEIKRGIYMNEDSKELIKDKVDLLEPNLTQSLLEILKYQKKENL